jgi:uncharacterized damage-inducible protein DinB
MTQKFGVPIPVLALVFALVFAFSTRAEAAPIPPPAAQPASAASPALPVDATPPGYDLKAQALADLADLQKEMVDLAKAVPAEKYSWRPMAGVRSFGEVFLHVAGTNFDLASAIGAPPIPGFKADGYDKSVLGKAQIIDKLNQSFDYTRDAIEKMSNADFRKPMKHFGPDANAGDIVYLITTHTHEHLGQSIAYARMNGIVPPWTAAAQQKMQHRPPQ